MVCPTFPGRGVSFQVPRSLRNPSIENGSFQFTTTCKYRLIIARGTARVDEMGKKSNGVVEVKPAVALIGTASGGKIGPPIGLLDIGVADGAYIFRVALPGEVSDLKFVIEHIGRVHISGIITEGKLMKDSSKVLRTITREIPPPGPFTVSFNLPGPVDSRLIEPRSRPGGILEVVILKSKKPVVPPSNH